MQNDILNFSSILNTAETDCIARYIVEFIRTNCPYIPENVFFDFQNLLETESICIDNMPSGVKVKEYLDGKSYEGQYNFVILYKALPDSLDERFNYLCVLDNISAWLEDVELFTDEPENISINYIRQLQSSYVLNKGDDGYVTYQSVLTLNYEKWGI